MSTSGRKTVLSFGNSLGKLDLRNWCLRIQYDEEKWLNLSVAERTFLIT